MKIKEILKHACLYLQLEDVKQYLESLMQYEQAVSNLPNKEENNETQTNEGVTQTQTTNGEEVENEETITLVAPELTTEVEESLNFLVEIVNAVCLDIATNYVGLKHRESKTVENNELSISSLEKPLYKIISITSNGEKVKFYLSDNLVKVQNKNIDVYYEYLPSRKTINEGVEDFNGKVSLLTLVYGIASEYCLIKGDYEQAVMWEEKYKNNLLNNARKARNITIRKRRWF